MDNNKLEKGLKLKRKIDDTSQYIDYIKAGVCVKARVPDKHGHFFCYDIPVEGELLFDIQGMVVAHLEEKLSEYQTKYNTL